MCFWVPTTPCSTWATIVWVLLNQNKLLNITEMNDIQFSVVYNLHCNVFDIFQYDCCKSCNIYKILYLRKVKVTCMSCGSAFDTLKMLKLCLLVLLVPLCHATLK